MILAIVMLGPWFAIAGLAAVGLAVWMHLYERVASRRVPMSSLRLVPETPRVARNRRKIRRWPLFLLRALGVILLGLAFARPGLPGGSQAPVGGREAVVFVLDRSASMAMRSPEGNTAWEEAVARVQNRLAGLHPESRVRLFCFPPAATGHDWSKPPELRQILAGLAPSMADGQPFEALRDAAEAVARFRSDMPESLEVIGDMQRHGWEEIDTLMLPEELRVQVNQTGNPAAANRSLSLGVRGFDQLRRGVVELGGGSSPLLVSDQAGEDGKTEEQEIPLPDKVLELPYRSGTNGWVRREISFRQSTDGLAEDDRLFDVFLAIPEVPVLLLEPHPERDVFLQTTFFLNQALRPTVGDGAADSKFLPKVVAVKDAVAALRGLEDSEAVVVVPPLAAWPADLPAAVQAFAHKGGGVVFFAGPEIPPADFTTAWRSLLPVLPGAVSTLEGGPALEPIGTTHPLWGSFGADLREALRKAPLRKRFTLGIVEGAEVMARYADEVPLVARGQAGRGLVLFVNTSPDRSWGDWSADGVLFVPTVHVLVSAVLSSPSHSLRNSPGAGIAGAPFDVRVDPALGGKLFRVDDKSLKADEQGWLRGLNFDRPGLFDILTEEGGFVRPVAVNFPPAESRCEFFLPAILERQIAARRRAAGTSGEVPRIDLASESGWWRWILAALAVVWLVEPWLAFRPKQQPDGKGLAS
ncbi:MAG: BatA domain-containing protein [Verrucomicrobiales bacterium]